MTEEFDQELYDARINAALTVRAAIEFGKYMPSIFVSDFMAENPPDSYLEIERFDDYEGESGWLVTVVPESDE